MSLMSLRLESLISAEKYLISLPDDGFFFLREAHDHESWRKSS
jgi:hypothetical protein